MQWERRTAALPVPTFEAATLTLKFAFSSFNRFL